MRLCKPFFGAKPTDIVQFFGVNPQPYQPNGHSGIDWVKFYGAFQVAPERSKIVNIITPRKLLEEGSEEWRKYASYGYGVVMESIVNPGIYHLQWHCLPVFPVEIGDIVEQGQITSQMGNWGFVTSGGIYVPIENRNDKPYPGTHLHQEMFREVGGKREYLNPLLHIDWSIEPKYDILTASKSILNRMLSLLLNR